MTAIRSFPNAPLARQRMSAPARVPDWARALWKALHRAGQRRAAWELDRLAERYALRNPVLARQMRAAAAACRHPQDASTHMTERSLS